MSRQKIRIAYILTKLELGGAQKHVLSLIEHLDPERFETVLITSSEQAPLLPYAKGLLGERLIQIPSLKREIQPFSDLKAGYHILSVLKEYSLDIVHTHSSKAGIIGRWAAWKAGIPTIIHTVHGFGFAPSQPLWERRLLIAAEQRAALMTDCLVAVSKLTLEEGCSLGIGIRSQYEWIPCGIDPVPFKTVHPDSIFQLRQELRIPEQSPLVTMVACFKPQKSPLDFVRIAAKVSQRFPQARFLMVGDGVLRAQIEKERDRLGIGEKLTLSGWRWDIPIILAASDVVVLTSRWEGLPLTLLEAMATARPMVATNVGGNSEVIHHGENGFLTNPGDIPVMAGAIIQLLEDPVRAINMGKQGRELFPLDYHLAETVARLQNLYTSSVLCPTPLS